MDARAISRAQDDAIVEFSRKGKITHSHEG
jgi:hypothetical protein